MYHFFFNLVISWWIFLCFWWQAFPKLLDSYFLKLWKPYYFLMKSCRNPSKTGSAGVGVVSEVPLPNLGLFRNSLKTFTSFLSHQSQWYWRNLSHPVSCLLKTKKKTLSPTFDSSFHLFSQFLFIWNLALKLSSLPPLLLHLPCVPLPPFYVSRQSRSWHPCATSGRHSSALDGAQECHPPPLQKHQLPPFPWPRSSGSPLPCSSSFSQDWCAPWLWFIIGP